MLYVFVNIDNDAKYFAKGDFYTARTMICFPAIIIAMLIVMDRCKIENVNKLCFIFVILLVSYSFSLSAKLGAVIKITMRLAITLREE